VKLQFTAVKIHGTRVISA